MGGTGMIGRGALNAALDDIRVTRVLSVVRRASGVRHKKLIEIVHDDFFDFSGIESELAKADICLFCLGITSTGQTEENYRRITYDLTLEFAQTLVRLRPDLTFVFVSGAGTSVKSRQMWARVKGETERALSALPFANVYHARPGFIKPVEGARSRTALYRVLYGILTPLYPILKRLAPNAIIDSNVLGRALLEAGLSGAPENVLETSSLHDLASKPPGKN